MRPVSPVVPGFEADEIVFGKDQSADYIPLPALPIDNSRQIITRWRFTWRERLRIFLGGDLYLWVYTFGRPLQPVQLETIPPELGKVVKP